MQRCTNPSSGSSPVRTIDAHASWFLDRNCERVDLHSADRPNAR